MRFAIVAACALLLAGCATSSSTSIPSLPPRLESRFTLTASHSHMPILGLVPEADFSPRDPFTERHDTAPADPKSTSWLSELFASKNGGFTNLLEFAVTDQVAPGPGDHGASPAFAIYHCRDTATCHPYTFTCTLYGGGCPAKGKTFYLPPGAYPEQGCGQGGGECHTEVIDEITGSIVGWYVMQSPYRVPLTGKAIAVGYAGYCPLDAYANGGTCDMADTAGSIPVISNLVRPEELTAAIAAKGDLGHALYVTACMNHTSYWPSGGGTGSDDKCPPRGAFVVLRNWSDDRIAAAPIPEAARVFYRTLAHYGYILSDNNARPLSLGFEDPVDRYPAPNPWTAVMAAVCAEDERLDCSVSTNSYHTQLPVMFKQSDLTVIQSPQ